MTLAEFRRQTAELPGEMELEIEAFTKDVFYVCNVDYLYFPIGNERVCLESETLRDLVANVNDDIGR